MDPLDPFAALSEREKIDLLLEVHKSPLAMSVRQGVSDSLDDTRSWVDPNGYRLSDRLWNQRQNVRRQIDQRLREGIARGEDALSVARDLEGYLNPAYRLTRTRAGRIVNIRPGTVTEAPYRNGRGSFAARRLARTEVTRAFGQTTDLAADGLALPVKWNLSNRHPDADRCDANASGSSPGLSAGVYHVRDCPSYPDHPMCFPAGTAVSGPMVHAASKRWYTGNMIRIRTCEGHDLSVTPNHPILTDRGWIAAGKIMQSDRVVCDRVKISQPFAGIQPGHEHEPTVIENVAISLRRSIGSTSIAVPVAAEQFHGDGIGKGNVDVVRANRALLHDGISAITENAGELGFHRRNPMLAFLARSGNETFGVERLDASTRGSMSRSGHTLTLLRRHGGEANPDLFGHGSFGDSGLAENAGSDLATHAELRSDTLFRASGEIQLCNVESISVREFAGHVYNLQTSEQWYSANGVIVHNCLCTKSVHDERTEDELVDYLRQKYDLPVMGILSR